MAMEKSSLVVRMYRPDCDVCVKILLLVHTKRAQKILCVRLVYLLLLLPPPLLKPLSCTVAFAKIESVHCVCYLFVCDLAVCVFFYFQYSLIDSDGIEKRSKPTDLDCGTHSGKQHTLTHNCTHLKSKSAKAVMWLCAYADKWVVLIHFVAAFVASKRNKSRPRAQCNTTFCACKQFFI